MTQGASGGLVTLVVGHWEAWVVPERALDLKRNKLDPSPFGDLPSVRLVSMSRLGLGN